MFRTYLVQLFYESFAFVQEYAACFVEMAKYAEHQVPTEGRKMERFIRGLRTDIREIVSTQNLTTFQEPVGAAKEVEKAINTHLEEVSTYSIKRIQEKP
ncbi:hypothetical protein CTI12_AA077190 [Artemisia annua]|uniref:Uncharacterized protein n=1 Tax=Artemisia annua TaxID=35608 RepID=A0A2U1Q4H4_ARTAN|nr:hypothetical protein CTI12_AA077190 [Artemisia annua]